MGELFRLIVRSGKRLAVFVVGVALVLLGIASAFLPGIPGFLLVFAGLAVLATEFAWAAVLRDKARDRATKAGNAIRRRFRRDKPEDQGDADVSASGGSN